MYSSEDLERFYFQYQTCDETWCRVRVEDTYRKRYILCMVHARAKFKYALEQSDDKDTGYILGCMGELYGLEREYEQGKLSP